MNMDKDFIKAMFENQMDRNVFNFKDEELLKAKKEKIECNQKLFETLNTLIAEDERNIIKNLIQDYRDINSKYIYLENMLYYKAGFKDGLCIKNSLEN